MARRTHMVTGAFGYSGKYIAHRLLKKGHRVSTLTNSLRRRNSFGDRIEAYPFNFNDRLKLKGSLRDVKVLYNTYWVRFNHTKFDHETAVKNTLTLFHCAKRAGVERIVHISITNPSETSDLEYFKGKALLEKALIDSGLSYSILRPTVLFGDEDILINNIAWILRRFPIFLLFGSGKYRLQPIFVDDLAALAVDQGEVRENSIINAIGPETFTYKDLVQYIGQIIEHKRPIFSVPPIIGYLAGKTIGVILDDIVITREEIKGLMADLLYVDSPPAGRTKLSAWVRQNSETLGRHYASELKRRGDRVSAYKDKAVSASF